MNPMTSNYRWSIVIALVMYSTGLSNPPEITFTSPLAVAPGQTTVLHFYGKNLDGATHAWTGFPAETTFLSPEEASDNKSTRASVGVAGDVPVGIYAARIATSEGVSQAILMMVDDLPSIGEEPQNHSRKMAQPVHPPISVDGAGDGDKIDCFCVDASAGQWLTIEVVSSRLGYSLDAFLRVFDESGEEIATVDDTPGLSGDCRVRFQSPLKQRIFIEVCDSSYSSSARHQYRLRIGDFPSVTTTFPLACTIGEKGSSSFEKIDFKLGFCSDDGAIVPPTSLKVAGLAESLSIPIAARFSDRGGAAIVRHAVSSLPNLNLEGSEPNDCKERAWVLKAPVAIDGVILGASDTFYYRIPLTAGSRRTIRSITRSLGSPSDLLMKVYAPDGTLLATYDDSGLDDATFELDAKIVGDYLLTVHEINRQYGPGYSFRFEVSSSQDGFELSAKEERVNIGKGGVGLLPIVCKRKGFKGPIELRIDDPDTPFRLENNVINAAENETLLKLFSRVDLPLGSLNTIQITGYGGNDGTIVMGKVSVVDKIRTQFPSMAYPPVELWNQIAVAIAQPLPDFFGLRLASDEALFPRVVGEMYFTVYCVNRIEGYTAAIHVEAMNLPNGFRTSGQDKPVGNSKNNEYRFELRGPADAPIGQHKISVRAIGDFRGQAKEVVISDVPFLVVDPLKVSLESSTEDSKRSEVSVRVHAKRYLSRAGGDQKEIHCRWKERPDWLVCPDSFVIDAGKKEATIRMSVTENIDLPAQIGKLVLIAETSILGKTVQVESDAFEVRYPVPDKSQKD